MKEPEEISMLLLSTHENTREIPAYGLHSLEKKYKC